MPKVLSSDDMDFAAYYRDTEAVHKVRPAYEFMDEVVDELFGTHKPVGECLPWAKTHPRIRLRPGEVTLWAGINGHGKSLVTGMVNLSLMSQQQRVCVASFEMKPKVTLGRMARQWAGLPGRKEGDPLQQVEQAKSAYQQFGDWSKDRLWLYDQQGTVKPQTILGVIKYCAMELGVTHMVVDSLMKCVRGEDDYNGQKDFIDELCAVARDTGIHIHLVHHIKKLSKDDDIPTKNDVKGSGSITDQVDNVCIVWRNVPKEKLLDQGIRTKEGEPDCMLIWDKQRNGEWEGRITLWFDKSSQQFTAAAGAKPANLSDFPHRSWS